MSSRNARENVFEVERSPYVDNIKGLLIIFVVVGHLISYLNVQDAPLTTTLSNFIY